MASTLLSRNPNKRTKLSAAHINHQLSFGIDQDVSEMSLFAEDVGNTISVSGGKNFEISKATIIEEGVDNGSLSLIGGVGGVGTVGGIDGGKGSIVILKGGDGGDNPGATTGGKGGNVQLDGGVGGDSATGAGGIGGSITLRPGIGGSGTPTGRDGLIIARGRFISRSGVLIKANDTAFTAAQIMDTTIFVASGSRTVSLPTGTEMEVLLSSENAMFELVFFGPSWTLLDGVGFTIEGANTNLPAVANTTFGVGHALNYRVHRESENVYKMYNCNVCYV